MKTAVSIPDELFEQVEQLARRLDTSRSHVYRKALEDYIARHDVDRVRESLDKALSDLSAPEHEFARAAAIKILERSEW